MENVAGEDLNWFWRGWVINNWSFDQAVSKVKYVKNDPTKGAVITIENLEKMPFPSILDIKSKSGKVTRLTLPVEIWERNKSWSFKTTINEEIESVTLDPNHVFPDINSDNDTWTAGKGELEKDVILDAYLGTFSSKQIPVKIIFSEENGTLTGKSEGQPNLTFTPVGKDKFLANQAGLTIQFNENKGEFALEVNGQNFLFTRDK
jgi:hypothetical protein